MTSIAFLILIDKVRSIYDIYFYCSVHPVTQSPSEGNDWRCRRRTEEWSMEIKRTYHPQVEGIHPVSRGTVEEDYQWLHTSGSLKGLVEVSVSET